MDLLRNPVLMFIPAPLIGGLIIGLIVGLISGSWLAAIVTLVLAALLIGAGLWFGSDALALRLVGARPLADDGSVHLRNQLEELCARAGVAEPELWTVGTGRPAIASLARAEPKIVVTDGLSDELNVVELEAALARELGRIRTGATGGDTLAVAFLTAPFALFGELAPKALDWFRGGDHDARVDLEGVGITRYPPGLTAALEKMNGDDAAGVSGSKATRHLWATGQQVAEPTPGRWALDDRVEMLRQL